MKHILITLLSIIICITSFGQNVGINSTGAAPDASAMLDIDATDKGLLIPRVALSSLDSDSPIGSSVETSLMVYNTATAGTAPNAVTPGFYYWDGSVWVRLVNTGDTTGREWSLTGNTGTTAGTNFIGTIDEKDLVFKRFNVQSGLIAEFNTAFGNSSFNNNTAD